jgi:hypothetical protein
MVVGVIRALLIQRPDFIDLNPNSDRGKEMKARMNAGDHSIYQLLVNLASKLCSGSIPFVFR